MMRRMNRRVLWTAAAACILAGGCASQQDDFGFARQPKVKSGASARASKRQDKAENPRILPETHYAAGRVFEQQGSPEKAAEQYRKAIAVNHNYTAAYARLGLMLSIAGEHEQAIEAFSKAVELKPGSAILQNNLGFEYLYVENWDLAEQHLRQATKLDPRLPQAHINLGILLGRTERYEPALASFRKVLPEPDAHYNLGLLHRAQGRYALASESFQRVLTINPEFTAARRQLVLVNTNASTTPTLRKTNDTPAETLANTKTTGPQANEIEPELREITTTGQKGQVVDLQALIDEMITDPTALPAKQTTTKTIESNPVIPTTHRVGQSIEIPAQTPTAYAESQTLLVGTETIKPVQTIEPAMPTTVVTPVTTVTAPTTRFESAAPAETQTLLVGMETIKPVQTIEPAMPTPVVTSVTTVTSPTTTIEPAGHLSSLNLRDVAREQNLAERHQQEIIPVQTIVPTSSAVQPHDRKIPFPEATPEAEVVLVLAESETRPEPEFAVEPVITHEPRREINRNTQMLDDMEVSLQVLRNEVQCQKETNFEQPVEISTVQPVAFSESPTANIEPIQVAGEPVWGDVAPVPVAEPSMKVLPSEDPTVARIPVTAVESVGNPTPGPAALSAPTEPKRVNSNASRRSKSERSRKDD